MSHFEEYNLYSLRQGDRPVQYRYGESWVAMQLSLEGGYPTPEEAKAAWFAYLSEQEGKE